MVVAANADQIAQNFLVDQKFGGVAVQQQDLGYFLTAGRMLEATTGSYLQMTVVTEVFAVLAA